MSGCVCQKHMLERVNGGTCVWCGHGVASAVEEHAYRRNMEEVPSLVRPAQFDARVVPLRRGLGWTEDSAVGAYYAWKGNHGRFPKSIDWQRASEPGERRPSYTTIRNLFGGWRGFLAYIADIPREQVAA